MRSFALVSLGCPKNLVDSEFIRERLAHEGYTPVSYPADAGLVVVNTCAFLTEAVEESIRTILEFIDQGKQVVCAGCMVSRYGQELLRELPEVGLFAGPGTYADLDEALRTGTRYLPARFGGVVKRSQPSTGAFAYVKVSEGCSNRCSYCLIPRIRGGLASKPLKEILAECRALADRGVKEIILVAQDVGSYGSDTADSRALPHLIEKISLIDGIEWIRLMYMHPATTTEPVIEAMLRSPRVVPYIDLPIQHISQKVLAAMGRRGGADAVWRALDLLRSKGRGIRIRSTVMVGHPGEDDREFDELEDFIRKGYIDHLGVFAYSPEQGTKSFALGDPVPREIKEGRRDVIMSIQQEISRKSLQRLVGSRLNVLVERFHPETDLLLTGRAAFQAPEVDGTVIINEGTAVFGAFSEVEITDTMEYDLLGRIA